MIYTANPRQIKQT